MCRKAENTISAVEIPGRAETYREQARHYMQAVRLGFPEEPAGFRLIFVRLGIAERDGLFDLF